MIGDGVNEIMNQYDIPIGYFYLGLSGYVNTYNCYWLLLAYI